MDVNQPSEGCKRALIRPKILGLVPLAVPLAWRSLTPVVKAGAIVRELTAYSS